ncbi:MAG: hypothetical protein NVS9B10_24470 [Nevskia sp.]
MTIRKAAPKKTVSAVKKALPKKAVAPIDAPAQMQVQLGYQMHGHQRMAFGQDGSFRATTANGSIPVPTGPGRIPDDWSKLKVIHTIAMPEHGCAMDIAVRFRSQGR